MADLKDAIGNSLTKIQSGIEGGKKMREISKEIYRLRKDMGEACEAKGKLYCQMGMQAYYLFRQGSIGDDLLKNLGGEIMELDIKLWQLDEEIASVAKTEHGSFCTNCGQPIGDKDKFCNSCGNALEDQPEAKAACPCPMCSISVPSQTCYCPCCGHKIGGENSVL
jgi:hypothetical protein